jgi:hypothetical protein
MGFVLKFGKKKKKDIFNEQYIKFRMIWIKPAFSFHFMILRRQMS